MRLSSLADYAVVLMSAASRHCAAARLAGSKLNASTLSRETGVPLPTAQNLVCSQSAAGLLESTRSIGSVSGLARPPSSLCVAVIVEAVEGPLAITGCLVVGTHACKLEDGCPVKSHLGAVI